VCFLNIVGPRGAETAELVWSTDGWGPTVVLGPGSVAEGKVCAFATARPYSQPVEKKKGVASRRAWN
jgi:hypothetical protein